MFIWPVVTGVLTLDAVPTCGKVCMASKNSMPGHVEATEWAPLTGRSAMLKGAGHGLRASKSLTFLSGPTWLLCLGGDGSSSVKGEEGSSSIGGTLGVLSSGIEFEISDMGIAVW
jgi:hypothetical protein